MNYELLPVLKEIRRYIWLSALVVVLILLLIYKFTESEVSLILVFASVLAAILPLGVLTMFIDQIEND